MYGSTSIKHSENDQHTDAHGSVDLESLDASRPDSNGTWSNIAHEALKMRSLWRSKGVN